MASDKGASIAHLHVRDQETGSPSASVELYGDLIEGIRKYNKEIIICVSLSGRVNPDPYFRSAVLSLDGGLKPDMGSLTLSSLNFSKSESINSPNTISILSEIMALNGILPELEIFDLGMVNAWRYFFAKELISKPFYFNVIVGNVFGSQSLLSHYSCFENELSSNGFLSFGGVGSYQLEANSIAIARGHHVRVGLEDNIWLDSDKKVLATNEALLDRVISLANIHERQIISPLELRGLLNLNSGNGNYGLQK